MKGDRQSDLGTVLAILRMIRGLDQDEAAKAAGLRAGTISDYERGKMIPGLESCRKLLAAEGYSFSAIDQARAFMETMRRDHGESAPEAPTTEAESLQWKIGTVSAVAGNALAQVVRLALELLCQAAPADRAVIEGRAGKKA